MSRTYPQMSEATLLLGNISAEQVSQQHVTPPALSDGEYIATLSTSSPGAPGYVIGQRVSGKPYDHIVMNYGPAGKQSQRIWRLAADRGARVNYEILHDTSSTGFASAQR